MVPENTVSDGRDRAPGVHRYDESELGIGWPVGLAFGFGSALASSVGFLMRHRGAVAAPDVDVRRPLRTINELFRQKWWAIGFGIAAAAWALQVIALKLAPLSLVQTALASSFVFLGVFAERVFGLPLGRRQWLGIGLATAGLALLAVTAGHAAPSGAHSGYGVAVAVAFEAGLVAAGVAFILWPRLGGGDDNGPSALLLAAAAGLLFTVSHIGIKAVAGSASVGSLAWLPLIVGAFLGAFFGSARSLQVGDAVPVIAVTSAVSNASAIVGGILVFDDPIGGSAFVVALRIAAFALVVLAAALIPAPVRTADPGSERVGQSEPLQKRLQTASRPG